MIINAVSYARFSSNNQREASIEIQQEHINQYCKDNGITIIKEYVDRALSATSDNRPQFQQMIKDAESGLFSYVVVYNSSRFCRNIQDHLKYREILESNGVRIISVNENFDESTPEGDLMSNFMMSINQYYSRDLGRKAYLGCLETARECKHVGGVPLFGYKVNENQKYEIEESEAKIVRIIFDLLERGKTRTEICNVLDCIGATNRNGKPFRADFVRMAENRKYIGEFVWNLNSHRNKNLISALNGNTIETEVVRIPNGMPAIITKEQFIKVQEVLKKRKNDHNIKFSRQYLLSSLLRCGCCGYHMYVDCNKNGNGKGNWTRLNYRCYSKNKKRSECDTKDYKVQYLDTYIINLLMNVLLNLRYSIHITNLIRDKLGADYDENKKKLRQLQIEMKDNNFKIKNLINSLAEARTIAYQEIIKEIERLTKTKSDLQDEIDLVKADLNTYPVFNEGMVLSNIDKMRKQIKSRTVEFLKPVLKVVLDEIVLSNDKVVVRVDLNAYINEKCKNNMIIEIVEEAENIKDTKKQFNQKLTWDALMINI